MEQTINSGGELEIQNVSLNKLQIQFLEFENKREKCKQHELLLEYTLEHSLRLHPVQEKLRAATLNHPLHPIMASPDVTQLLQNLIQLTNAKKIIEVGVFTGYSTLAFALALGQEGKVLGCEINEEFVKIGKPFWKEAGVDHKICIRFQPALVTLDGLLANGEEGTYDLVFIDADKGNYPNYYEKSLQLLRKGGIIALDNVLWRGSVVDPNTTLFGANDIKEFNSKLKDDKRINISMLTVGDGLTLAFKI